MNFEHLRTGRIRAFASASVCGFAGALGLSKHFLDRLHGPALAEFADMHTQRASQMKQSVLFRSLSALTVRALKADHVSQLAVHVCGGLKLHKRWLAITLTAAGLLAFAGSAKASSFTYTVDFSMGSDVVTGSIVTTCDNCALSAANISSYLFTDTDGNTVSSTGSIHTPLDFTADPLFATSTAITDTAPVSGTDESEFFGTSAFLLGTGLLGTVGVLRKRSA